MAPPPGPDRIRLSGTSGCARGFAGSAVEGPAWDFSCHTGLAIPDFPLAYGKVWPATDSAAIAQYNQHRLEVTALNPISAFQIILQLAHRLMAVLIVGALSTCVWLAHKR